MRFYKMYTRAGLLSFIMMSIMSAGAQKKVPDALAMQLEGKTRYHDIRNTVEAYFKNEKSRVPATDSILIRKLERQRKFWNRELYWAESHLNPQGEVENFTRRIFDYLQQEPQQVAAPSANANWVPIGPVGVDDGVGRVNRIAFHPTNASIIYAGTPQGGLWKTINSGLLWQPISSFIPSLGISGIVVDRINPDIIYILTGDGDADGGGFVDRYGYIRFSVGVLKSTNGGITWEPTGAFPLTDPSVRYTTYNLVASPANNNLLLAATSIGLFRTSNGGSTWTRCDIGAPGAEDDEARVWDVAFKPGSATEAYCTVSRMGGSQFYRSADGGVSFTTSNAVSFNPTSFTSSAERIKIAVTPVNPALVYLLAGPGNVISQTFKGIWASTNSGVSFSRRSNSPDILGYSDIINDFDDQNTYDLALAVSPTNGSILVTGGLVAWRSTNGGVSLDEIVDYFTDLANSNYIHPDVHDLQYNPLDGRLWAATDGGVAVSADNGSTWSRRFNMQISAFYRYKVSNQDNKRWGGTQDCGTLLQNSGTLYDHFDGGDGYDVMTDKAPAGNNNDDYWVINKAIWTDGIADIEITPPQSDNFFPNLDMCPNNEDILYAGYEDLWYSLDRGDNWSRVIGSGGSAAGNWCVATCPSLPSVMYSAGIRYDANNQIETQGIFRITGANTSNADIDFRNSMGFLDGNKITDIAVNSSNENDVWITVGGFSERKKVFRSTNGGRDWTNFSGNLPNLPVNCILVDGSLLYVGTDIGVYYRRLTDADWTPFYNGLPRVPVTQLHKTINSSNFRFYLEASTFGRGLWQTEVFANCDATVTLADAQQGQQFFQAATTLNSTAEISGGQGTRVFYQSGNLVSMKPGFHVYAGNRFKASIAPCSSGISVQRVQEAKTVRKKNLAKKKTANKNQGQKRK